MSRMCAHAKTENNRGWFQSLRQVSNDSECVKEAKSFTDLASVLSTICGVLHILHSDVHGYVAYGPGLYLHTVLTVLNTRVK